MIREITLIIQYLSLKQAQLNDFGSTFFREPYS